MSVASIRQSWCNGILRADSERIDVNPQSNWRYTRGHTMTSGIRRTVSPSQSVPFALVILAISVACGGGNQGKPITGGEKPLPVGKDSSAVASGGDAKVDAKAEGGDTKVDAKAEGGDTKVDAKADGGDTKVDAKADGPGTSADETGVKSTTGLDEGKADGDDAKADDTGGAAPADPVALQAEIKGKKTTDERALVALAELETSGAKLRDVAKAANARGEKLFEAPERAKTFFEWAAAKDPKYPDPLFNLAKQTATTGDVEATREYLKQVKARGGKKLLSQVDFDPMWEIVKDDPEVRKLLEG